MSVNTITTLGIDCRIDLDRWWQPVFRQHSVLYGTLNCVTNFVVKFSTNVIYFENARQVHYWVNFAYRPQESEDDDDYDDDDMLPEIIQRCWLVPLLHSTVCPAGFQQV